MPPAINMKGKTFNYLKVIERARNTKSGEAAWLCECKCGKRKIVPGSKLRKGEIKSCGCMKRELCGIVNKTHGMKGTRLYNIWQTIIQRTTNKNNHEYCDYGGRGIGICEEWRNNFEVFMQWSYENGYADNLTIDRTKTITEWAEITGLGKEVIRYRIVKMGWSAEKALTTPKMKNKKQP